MGLRDNIEYVTFNCHDIQSHNDHVSATYTNLENHPRLIRVRDPKPVPKITLDRKTGLPSLVDRVQGPHKIKNTVTFINTSNESEDSEKDGMLFTYDVLTQNLSGCSSSPRNHHPTSE